MADQREPSEKVEIAHVLAMDVIGYSLLLITDQARVMNQLASLVKTRSKFAVRMQGGSCCVFPPAMACALSFSTIRRRRSKCRSRRPVRRTVCRATGQHVSAARAMFQESLNVLEDLHRRGALNAKDTEWAGQIAGEIAECDKALRLTLGKK